MNGSALRVAGEGAALLCTVGVGRADFNCGSVSRCCAGGSTSQGQYQYVNVYILYAVYSCILYVVLYIWLLSVCCILLLSVGYMWLDVLLLDAKLLYKNREWRGACTLQVHTN